MAGYNLAVANSWDPASQSFTGRLVVFFVDRHGTVLFNAQANDNGSAGWLGWTTLGGGYHIQEIAIGQNGGGTLELFAMTNHGSPLHIWQMTANDDTSWGGSWDNLVGGIAVGEPTLAQFFRLPASIPGQGDGQVFTDTSFALEVFALQGTSTPGVPYTVKQLPAGFTGGTGGWQDWMQLGDTSGGSLQFTQLTVGRQPNGLFQVYGLTGGGTVWFITQEDSQAIQPDPWSSWGLFPTQDVGENATPMQQIVVGQNADRHLELFALDGDGIPWHIYQEWDSATGWSPWELLGALPGGVSLKQLVVGQNAYAPGPLEVFAIDSHGTPWHIWQDPNGIFGGTGGWSPWEYLSGGHAANYLAVGQNTDGHLEVFDLTSHGSVYHTWQTPTGAGGWSAWVPL